MNPTQNIYLIVGLVAALLFNSCSSWGELTLVGSSYKVRLYAVTEKSYPAGDSARFLPPARPFPKLTVKQLTALLSHLHFDKYGSSSSTPKPVFYSDDLEYLVPRIMDASPQIGKGKRLVVIYRHIPTGNLLKKNLRYTMVIWHDAQGVNIIIGEIRKPLISEDLISEYDDWDEVSAIDIEAAPTNIVLNVSPPYRRKSLKGIKHETWITIALNDINTLIKKTKQKKKDTEGIEDIENTKDKPKPK